MFALIICNHEHPLCPSSLFPSLWNSELVIRASLVMPTPSSLTEAGTMSAAGGMVSQKRDFISKSKVCSTECCQWQFWMKLLEHCNEAKRSEAPEFGGFPCNVWWGDFDLPCNKIIIWGEVLANQKLNKHGITDAFRVISHIRTGNSPLGTGSFPTEVNKRQIQDWEF